MIKREARIARPNTAKLSRPVCCQAAQQAELQRCGTTHALYRLRHFLGQVTHIGGEKAWAISYEQCRISSAQCDSMGIIRILEVKE